MAEKANGVGLQYEPLPDPQIKIRLLRIEPGDGPIHCTMKCGLIEKGTYSCLSYTWGDASRLECIYIDSRPCTVRENLYDFLHTARRYGVTESLWIDALCINQEDLVEKSIQVRLMGKIYQSAVRVIIWLGSIFEDGESEKLLRILGMLEERRPRFWCCSRAKKDQHEVSCPFGSHQQTTSLSNSQSNFRFKRAPFTPSKRKQKWPSLSVREKCRILLNAEAELRIQKEKLLPLTQTEFEAWQACLGMDSTLTTLLNAPYWTRVWTVQEVLLATTTIVLAPSGWLQLWNLLVLISTRFLYGPCLQIKSPEIFIEDRKRKVGYLMFLSEFIKRLDYKPWYSTRSLRLSRMLSRTWERHCHDDLDRVYSLLSLTENGKSFEIDYTISKLELYSRCLQHETRQGRGIRVSSEGFVEIVDSSAAPYFYRALRIESPMRDDVVCLSEIIDKCAITLAESMYVSFWVQVDVPESVLTKAPLALCTHFCEQGKEWLLVYTLAPNKIGMSRHPSVWQLLEHKWQQQRTLLPTLDLEPSNIHKSDFQHDSIASREL